MTHISYPEHKSCL